MDETIHTNGRLRVYTDDGDVWLEQKEPMGDVDIIIIDMKSIDSVIALLNKAKKELDGN